VVVLETERLLLRPFSESDLDAYAEMCADPEVMRYLLLGRTFSREESWEHLAAILGHWQLRGYGLWAVEHRESGDLVGRIGFLNPEGWPGFELAWTLARPYWGNGYATEGARAAMAHGFLKLKRQRIISLIHPENERSIRLAKRLGESLRGSIEFRGKRVHLFAIDRRDWDFQQENARGDE
jgi:RimJ/RimL family protein N-acetyltransferase